MLLFSGLIWVTTTVVIQEYDSHVLFCFVFSLQDEFYSTPLHSLVLHSFTSSTMFHKPWYSLCGGEGKGKEGEKKLEERDEGRERGLIYGLELTVIYFQHFDQFYISPFTDARGKEKLSSPRFQAAQVFGINMNTYKVV